MAKQVPVPIIKMNEPSFEIHLANGAVIRSRTVVMNVDQVMNDDGSPMLAPDGKAMYAVAIQNLNVVITDAVERKEMN